MNRHLQKLHDYPFTKLRALLGNAQVTTEAERLSLAVGEPQAAPPRFVLDAIENELCNINRYPLAQGTDALRKSIADWLAKRYDIHRDLIDEERHVLPLQGSREGLFAIAQVVVDSGGAGSKEEGKPIVALPSPFYQIYEGAAFLAGADPLYLPCDADTGFAMNLDGVSEEEWQRCQLLYICSPSNPTGHIASIQEYQQLLDLADRFDFVIVSDECYSEIYYDETAPSLGLLDVCNRLGRTDYSRCLVFNSLSKRSNLAGMRSGFVAGDPDLINAFLQYRTYHGSAMPLHHQVASVAAWQDERHVIENRAMYRRTFDSVISLLERHFTVGQPAGGFCLWLPVTDATGMDDMQFAKALYEGQGVTVLPGSFLARDILVGGEMVNPGSGFIRAALVYPTDKCVEAVTRICTFVDDIA